MLRHAEANGSKDIPRYVCRCLVESAVLFDSCSALSSHFCHRYGSRWISYPRWQLGPFGENRWNVEGPLKPCLTAIKEMARKKNGHLFGEPVDPLALDLPDYFEVIEDPLDLGTIQRTIEHGFYLQADRDGRSGLRCVIEDVGVVWANALLYNKPESPVYQIAEEFKAAADLQFEKIAAESDSAAERALCERLGLGGYRPQQLVMDRYMFLDEQGAPLLPEDLLQLGVRSARLVGNLVRRGGSNSGPRPEALANYDDVWELRPVAWHFHVAEPAGKGTSAADVEAVAVWVRTETSWVRLLQPAEDWAGLAGPWLERVWACLLFRRCLGDAPRDPYEKLLRSLSKSAADGRPAPRSAEGVPRHEDSRARDALLDLCEYAVVCAEQCQRAVPAKLSEKECQRLAARLLEEAERRRAALPSGESAAGGAAETSTARRRLDLEKVRAAVEEDAAAIARLRSPAGLGGVDTGDGASAGGYWERDADGNRHWVQSDATVAAATKPKAAKRKSAPPPPPAAEEAEPGRPRRTVAETLAAEPLECKIGARVRVLFDDQVWYAGTVTDYDAAADKWHVVFAEEDEDDVGFPDPDVELLPPVYLMLQVGRRGRSRREGGGAPLSG